MVLSNHYSGMISPVQARRFLDAGCFAFCINRPLNRMINIHLEAGGVRNSHKFNSRFLKLAGEWLRRRSGFPACHQLVLENPPSGQKDAAGLHVHILIHVPYSLQKEFWRSERRWAASAGAECRKGVVRSEMLKHSRPGDCPEEYLRYGYWGAARYLLKGIDPAAAAPFHIEPSDQGVVRGKRTGISEALGEQHRWHPRRNVINGREYWLAGPDSRRRRLVKLSCPELLGLPPLEEDDPC